MRRVVFVISAAALLWPGLACRQAPDAGGPVPAQATVAPAGDAAIIDRLEREWVAAIVKNDAAAIDRLLAADFVGTSPTAHHYTKAMALSELESGTYVVKTMNLDEVSANVYGDTAVAFTSQQEESSYGGEDSSGHYHYTNVWVRQGGEWRVVASHGSRYAQAH